MIGGSEIIFIFLMILILFGANKIPDFAKAIGKGMHEFKKATNEIKDEINKHTEDTNADIQNLKSNITQPIDEVKQELKNTD